MQLFIFSSFVWCLVLVLISLTSRRTTFTQWGADCANTSDQYFVHSYHTVSTSTFVCLQLQPTVLTLFEIPIHQHNVHRNLESLYMHSNSTGSQCSRNWLIFAACVNCIIDVLNIRQATLNDHVSYNNRLLAFLSVWKLRRFSFTDLHKQFPLLAIHWLMTATNTFIQQKNQHF